MLISTRIPKTLRLSVTKCYKRSSFVTWMQNILHSTINTLETDEMWFLKRMLHEEVMDRTGTKKEINESNFDKTNRISDKVLKTRF